METTRGGAGRRRLVAKRTATLTLRTEDWVKAGVEEAAQQHGWTISLEASQRLARSLAADTVPEDMFPDSQTRAVLAARVGGVVAQTGKIFPLPIAGAAVAPGQPFGPCLIWPGPPRYPPCWVFGRWNGEEWCDEDGWLCYPDYWSPLPADQPLPADLRARDTARSLISRAAASNAMQRRADLRSRPSARRVG